MSRSADAAREYENIADAFVSLCGRIFKENGYDVEVEPSGLAATPDLLVREPITNNPVLVEAKVYRSTHPEPYLVQNSLHYLTRAMHGTGIHKSILIISMLLKKEDLELFQKVAGDNIEVWDLTKLASLTRPATELRSILADIATEIQINPVVLFGTPTTAEIETVGLGQRLLLCPEGQDGAQQFEKLCEEAFRKIFPNEFNNWYRQKNIDDGFHRYDLIARLTPKHDFWAGLVHDFNTRYVIFEFKNYSSPLEQNQIFTTEKYLFTKALRSVAIIVARNGFSTGANKAINGALREAGKLMLALNLNDLISMITAYNNGDDPTNALIEKFNELLMGIGR